MGAGASANKELSAEQKAKLDELGALDPAKQQELAAAAMRDLLAMASTRAVTAGKEAATWQDPRLAIPVPNVGTFQNAADTVAKIPMVGSGLAEAVMKPIEQIAAAFVACAVTVSASEGTLGCFTTTIAEIDTATAIAVGQGGGDAYATYLMTTAEANLYAALVPVVAEVLKTDDLTKLWGGAIDAYNSAAKKLGQEMMEFDLQAYVVEQVLATYAFIIADTEAAVRAGNMEGVTSETITKVFGGGLQAATEAAIKQLILVPKGDPRQLVFDADAMTNTKDAPLVVKAPAGLALVSMFAGPQPLGAWSYAMVGVGVGGAVPAGVGSDVVLKRDGNFLVTEWGGDGRKRTLGVSNNRYVEGNKLSISCHATDDKQTYLKYGPRDFCFFVDGSCSPIQKQSLVLGLAI